MSGWLGDKPRGWRKRRRMYRMKEMRFLMAFVLVL